MARICSVWPSESAKGMSSCDATISCNPTAFARQSFSTIVSTNQAASRSPAPIFSRTGIAAL